MFGNFIYFIVALLIFLTYQPSEEPNFNSFEALAIFGMMTILFRYAIHLQFKRIEKNLYTDSYSRLDHQFNAALTRMVIIAIVLYAISIYGLNISSIVSNTPILSDIPTLQALIMLSIFIGYLVMIWNRSYKIYQKLYSPDMSKKTYIYSHISFAVPVLLPWFFLSVIQDIIQLLPFQQLKAFLTSTEGQTIYFLAFLLLIAIVGPSLIQTIWRCKPLEDGYYRRRIEYLCQRAGLKFRNILYWPIFGGKMITAGVMGLVNRFRYILVTEALLTYLRPEEIDAVIAHEIGHVKKKHLLFYLFFFVGYMLVSYASFNLIIYIIIYAEPVLQLVGYFGVNHTTIVSGAISLCIILIFIIYFRFIFGYFMRNFERQADIYVYQLFETAIPLISTFEKIILTTGQSPDRPNWHHFSIAERIDYLKKCELDRTWIIRHENKIKKSIWIFCLGMVLTATVGYQLNFGETGKQLTKSFLEKVILQEIKKNPDNASLYSFLGDIYYSQKQYYQTVQTYEMAITLQPDNVHALNNLAWLYATCEDKSFLNPSRAVALAERAAQISQMPHIMDTLAESYYANNQFEKAVIAADHALRLATTDRQYYKNQLEKFRKAAANALENK